MDYILYILVTNPLTEVVVHAIISLKHFYLTNKSNNNATSQLVTLQDYKLADLINFKALNLVII